MPVWLHHKIGENLYIEQWRYYHCILMFWLLFNLLCCIVGCSFIGIVRFSIETNHKLQQNYKLTLNLTTIWPMLLVLYLETQIIRYSWEKCIGVHVFFFLPSFLIPHRCWNFLLEKHILHWKNTCFSGSSLWKNHKIIKFHHQNKLIGWLELQEKMSWLHQRKDVMGKLWEQDRLQILFPEYTKKMQRAQNE